MIFSGSLILIKMPCFQWGFFYFMHEMSKRFETVGYYISILSIQNNPFYFSFSISNYFYKINTFSLLIQSTELTQKGKGTLNVFASDLSSGIYTYTLVVDGKIIETRKMVKQ